jgi:hypothetical protein
VKLRTKRWIAALGAAAAVVLGGSGFLLRDILLEEAELYRLGLAPRPVGKRYLARVDWSSPVFRYGAEAEGGEVRKLFRLPRPVARKVRELFLARNGEYLDCAEVEGTGIISPEVLLYGTVVRFPSPDGLHVYAHCTSDPFTIFHISLLLHDPRTGSVSEAPWTTSSNVLRIENLLGKPGGYLEGPVISFDDLDGDGRPEVVVQMPYHNGTCIDWLTFTYLHAGPDLALRKIAEREDIPYIGWVRDGRDSPGTVRREFLRDGPGRLRLRILGTNWHGSGKDLELGSVSYAVPGPGQPLVELSQEVKVPEGASFVEQVTR